MGADCRFKGYPAIKTEAEEKIQQYGVALVLFHMQDFASIGSSVNTDKMDEFIDLANSFIRDGFTLMTVEQYYQYRTGGQPVRISQFAISASATSEHSEAAATYATLAPDAPKGGECSEWADWSGYGYTWSPDSWDIVAKLTLNYGTPVHADNLTIFGDHNMSWSKIWLRNSTTEKEKLVFAGTDEDCTSIHELDGDFLADTVILETSGWSWNATDAVQLSGNMAVAPICGNGLLEDVEDCDDGNLVDGDGCSSDCKIEKPLALCGNGVLEGREECDDGNPVDGDGCSTDCKIETLSGIVVQYAQYAEATSESPGHEARYSIGQPDSDGTCSTRPSLNTSWEKLHWDEAESLTLTFPTALYPDSLTVYGDYELCISHIWLWRENAWYLGWEGAVDKGEGDECTAKFDLGMLNFPTNKIRVETCGWRWSAIDTVQFSGTVDSFPRIDILNPAQDTVIDISEERVGIEISTDVVSECAFSDEDDFAFDEGAKLSTTDGITHSYTWTRSTSTDSVESYYKCKGANGKVSPYSIAHRFTFWEIDSPFIELCDWYDCAEGAASISIDDGYHTTVGYVKATCKEELEDRALKGSYYLAYTDIYSDSDWDLFRDAYAYGHEIGGHMGDCSPGRDEGNYTNDLLANIEDIVENVEIPRDELTTFAWPCGVTSQDYREWVSDYYLFERGYHVNLIESANPEDLQNIKSIDSVGFGDNPPDYYLLADVAENHQGWVNYVYHDTCDNPEIMDYLIAKNLWVETIGTVSKYIAERNSVRMQNVRETSTGVVLDLASDLDTARFTQELTFRIYLGNENLDAIKVNGQDIEFTRFMVGEQSYIKFNLVPSETTQIEISGLRVSIPSGMPSDEHSTATNWALVGGIIALSLMIMSAVFLIATRKKPVPPNQAN
jgi:cysteine-rich repeat protein